MVLAPPGVGDVRNVILMFAEGRDAELHDIEPLEEVGAELAVADAERQVAIRRRDKPHIDFNLLFSPNTHEASTFKNTQQQGLCLREKFPNFVKEQRPAVRHLEESIGLTLRSSERALFVSEEPARQKFGIDACAVERDERLILARRLRVDLLGDSFLAGSAFANNQHPRVRMRRHLIDSLLQGLHLKRLSDQLTVPVATVVLQQFLRLRPPRLRLDPCRHIADDHAVGVLVLVVAVDELRRIDDLMVLLRGNSRLLPLGKIRLELRDVLLERHANSIKDRVAISHASIQQSFQIGNDILRRVERTDPKDLHALLLQVLQRLRQHRHVSRKRNTENHDLVPLRTRVPQHFRKPPPAHTADIGLVAEYLQRRRSRRNIIVIAPAGQNQNVHLLPPRFRCGHYITI